MRLLESKPKAIEQWCVKVRKAGPKGKYLIDPLVDLDFNKLSPKLAEVVDNTLYYATFGHDKPQVMTEQSGTLARTRQPRQR